MATRPKTPLASEAWQEHEHIAPPLVNQAQRLLDDAGSPELAKHAVDAVAKSLPLATNVQSLATSAHDQFARQLGFVSYLSLFEASTPLRGTVGKQWFLTALRTDLWVVWNDTDLTTSGTHPTREAAERAIPPSDSGATI